MIPDRNTDLNKGMERTGNGIYIDKYINVLIKI